jgi:hypothetical protein
MTAPNPRSAIRKDLPANKTLLGFKSRCVSPTACICPAAVADSHERQDFLGRHRSARPRPLSLHMLHEVAVPAQYSKTRKGVL